jgi:hypothetical protein
MKQLTRKLFLSICTLAICAVTLVSTTLAWYTTNTEVNASGISGTATAAGDASILISNNGTDYAQSVSLAEKLDNAATLLPVQVLADGSFRYLDYKPEDTDPKDATGSVLHFKLWFKTAVENQTTKIYISQLNVKNNKALTELTLFDNLLYTGTNGTNAGLPTNQSKYVVDVVDTLCMKVVPSVGTVQFYDLENVVTSVVKGEENETIVTPNPADAEAYYEKVSDTTITENGTATLTSIDTAVDHRSEIIEVNYTGVYVDFYVFINGWDEYCYDAVKGQGFNLSLSFSSVEKKETTPSQGQ